MSAEFPLSAATTGLHALRALTVGTVALTLLLTGCATEDGAASDDAVTEDDAVSEVSAETVGEGPHALVTDRPPAGGPVDLSGELIVGPGGYLALAQEDKPVALVFDESADFSFRDGAPSVTMGQRGTVEVGEDVDLTGVEHPIDEIEGLPLERLGGADQSALILTAE